MKKIQLVLPGNAISLKNSKQIVPVKGRQIIISSQPYKTWLKAARQALKDSPWRAYPWRYPVVVRFQFFRKTRSLFDLHNMIQGSLDVLVEAGVLRSDDLAHCVVDLLSTKVILDPSAPRTVILISEGELEFDDYCNF